MPPLEQVLPTLILNTVILAGVLLLRFTMPLVGTLTALKPSGPVSPTAEGDAGVKTLWAPSVIGSAQSVVKNVHEKGKSRYQTWTLILIVEF